MTNDKMLARIAALLRQAEGTDNPHEADAFMSTAQRLATAASIDLAVARSHAGNRSPAQAPTQRTITIGAAGTRGLRTYVQLFVLIAAANDVRCDVASNSTFVYAYGFAEDIDTSHALYASLVVQMVRASDAYLASGAHRPTPTITARLNFQLAFGARVGQRLADAREQTRQEATKDRDRPPGTAIALRDKDIELHEYYRRSSKARGAWRASRATAGYSSAARRAVIERDGKHDSGTTPSCPGHGPRWAVIGADVPRDSQRARVYAAEAFVRTLFDRVTAHGSPTVEFFGTQLTLPPEGRFGSVASVQRYVDDVLALPAVGQNWPTVSPVRVRARRAATAAHYENHGGTGTIAVPDRHTAGWAMRELVVLHEVAHHLCQVPPPHGPEFVATVCTLTELVMGPEVGHVFRVVYAQEGVR